MCGDLTGKGGGEVCAVAGRCGGFAEGCRAVRAERVVAVAPRQMTLMW
jgi:hypothetical protein